MNRSDSHLHYFRPLRLLAAIMAALIVLAAPVRSQIFDVSPAIPNPNGNPAFVGSVTVSFPTLSSSLRGRIFYTLDGTNPTQNSIEYERPFEIKATTLLRSVRIRSGDRSDVNNAQFTKARLPAPVINYAGKPEFTGTKQVTLSANFTVPGSAPNASKLPTLYYTTDGGVPDTQYTGPFNISKTCNLIAVSTHPDYDNSTAATASFKLLIPVEKPVLNPKTGIFTAKTHAVAFTSATSGAYFQYTLGAASNPDTGIIATSATLLGNVPGEVITLRVVAKKQDMAPSAVTEEKYTYQPPAGVPAPTPPPSFFQDTLTIALGSATPGAAIHYTRDGSAPTTASPRYNDSTRIRIDTTTNLRAIAVKANQGNSDIFTGKYTLNLSAPVPSVSSSQFMDSVRFVLRTKSPTAEIYYTLDGQDPTALSTHYKRGDTITLTGDSTELRSVAIRGEAKSAVAAHLYVKTNTIRITGAPTVEPASQSFLDSIRVFLYTSDAAADIYFSENGGARVLYPRSGNGIGLKASTTLQVVAHKPGFDSSAPVLEKYVLIPSPPVASPAAIEPFPNRVEVRLTTKTAGAAIWYMLGKQDFNLSLAVKYETGNVLVFDQNKFLQAVATVGTGDNYRVSTVMAQDYIVYASTKGDSLPPNQELSLSQGLTLVNKGAASITAKLGSVEQLDLKGFKDPTHTVTVSVGAGQAAPKAVIIRPAGQSQAVYQMVQGRPVYVGSGTSVDITRPGTYFAAVDTMPPAITLAGETPAFNEGTKVKLQVIDNAADPSCTVQGSGLAAAGQAFKADPDGYISFTLKNAPSEIKDLWFRATASDSVNGARFPGNGGSYFLAQAWSKLTTPAVWNLGAADQPYDLAGFPIGADASLKWAQVKRDNPDPALTAYKWKDGGYLPLKDDDVVEPGLAFWLGSRNARATMTLSKFHSASQPDGRFRVVTRPGWNMVTNPSLGTLYWPSARTDKNFSQMMMRGLWGYDPMVEKDYVESDSLLPWKGYWVLNLTGADSVVELLTAPRPAAKRAAATETETQGKVEILLDHGRPFPLRLGARTYARDGVGVEDEPLLPFWNKSRQGWSARDKDRLMTDVMHFSPDQVLHWKVVLEGAPTLGRDSMVTVSGIGLPSGFEAWALSKRRNLKLRLQPGAGFSLPGSESDTLMVIAGPAAKLAALPELAHAVESVDAFESRPRMGRQGRGLYLALPSDAWVDASILSYSGRTLARVHEGRLGSGQHFLALPEAALAKGAAVLRVRVRGQGWAENRIHKIAW